MVLRGQPFVEIFVVPFVILVFMYMGLLDRGDGTRTTRSIALLGIIIAAAGIFVHLAVMLAGLLVTFLVWEVTSKPSRKNKYIGNDKTEMISLGESVNEIIRILFRAVIWLFAFLFTLAGILVIESPKEGYIYRSYASGLIAVSVGLFLVPSTRSLIEDKLELEIKWYVIILVWIVGGLIFEAVTPPLSAF